jgi:D-alanyl-D-alanine dipeptidase
MKPQWIQLEAELSPIDKAQVSRAYGLADRRQVRYDMEQDMEAYERANRSCLRKLWDSLCAYACLSSADPDTV